MGRKAVIAGGNGFIGTHLVRRLRADGWEVVVLTRAPAAAGLAREVAWDGRSVGHWAEELEGAAAVVNLAGRSVDCAPTEENRRAILDSRVQSVRAIGAAIARCSRPPPVWVQSSAVGYYGDAGDRICDEDTPAGDDFMAQVCRRWEQELAIAATPATRRVCLRIGLVLGPGGGVLAPLLRLTRWFLGGAVGDGRQYLSWVHVDDLTEILVQAMTREQLVGVYNACAPQPETNRDFMAELRHAAGRPWCPPAPASVVRLAARLVLRTDPDLALTGRRCIPARLQRAGFQFRHPDLRSALAAIVGRPPDAANVRNG